MSTLHSSTALCSLHSSLLFLTDCSVPRVWSPTPGTCAQSSHPLFLLVPSPSSQNPVFLWTPRHLPGSPVLPRHHTIISGLLSPRTLPYLCLCTTTLETNYSSAIFFVTLLPPTLQTKCYPLPSQLPSPEPNDLPLYISTLYC